MFFVFLVFFNSKYSLTFSAEAWQTGQAYKIIGISVEKIAD
ncbi:hypothetical protein VIM7927_03061 [Vibrio mangrovi]|uniref:Uncharacterized protein n=1 Tax=Vibrio mangrovi TaxID=474394 RepID=A0A1Y6IVQ0_9VIBR|nr:hypothetical protein VIM7927_03061 [Vibrio mangrovi]